MEKVRHRFLDHCIHPKTEILVIGTFNPDTIKNKADFFYSRPRNFLWTLLPTAFNEISLKGKSKDEKLKFIEKYKIDFIDLISEVEVDEAGNYEDRYLDNKVTNWIDVISQISKLPHLRQVCLTRKSFGDIPNMKLRVDEIKKYCEEKEIYFQLLSTPARFYRGDKQAEWTLFFRNNS